MGLLKRNYDFWFFVAISVLLIILRFITLDTLCNLGIILSPTNTIQDKTIYLFSAIRRVFPLIGLIFLAWLMIPNIIRLQFNNSIEVILHNRLTLPCILLIASIFRIIWVIYFPTKPYADSIWYFNLASGLSKGYGYVYDIKTMQPTAAWPIGYPAFLSLLFFITGPSQAVAKIANIVLSVLTIYLTYYLGRFIFNREVGILSSTFMAIIPGQIVYSSLIATDIFFMALTTLVLTLTIRQIKRIDENRSWVSAVSIGILLGACILVRGMGIIILPIVIFGFWMNFKDKLKPTLTWTLYICIGVSCVILPWIIRNYIQFHRFILVSTNDGVNFWIGNNPLAFGAYDFPRDSKLNPLYPLIGDEFAVQEMGYREGLKFISENPIKVLKLIPAKIFYLYNSNDFGLHWNKLSALVQGQPGTGPRIYAITNLVYILLAVLGIIGVCMLFRKPNNTNPLHWLGVNLAICLTMAHLPFFGQDRFVLPLLPFLTIYAGLGLSSIISYQVSVTYEK